MRPFLLLALVVHLLVLPAAWLVIRWNERPEHVAAIVADLNAERLANLSPEAGHE